jgi:hypothetical protein
MQAPLRPDGWGGPAYDWARTCAAHACTGACPVPHLPPTAAASRARERAVRDPDPRRASPSHLPSHVPCAGRREPARRRSTPLPPTRERSGAPPSSVSGRRSPRPPSPAVHTEAHRRPPACRRARPRPPPFPSRVAARSDPCPPPDTASPRPDTGRTPLRLRLCAQGRWRATTATPRAAPRRCSASRPAFRSVSGGGGGQDRAGPHRALGSTPASRTAQHVRHRHRATATQGIVGPAARSFARAHRRTALPCGPLNPSPLHAEVDPGTSAVNCSVGVNVCVSGQGCAVANSSILVVVRPSDWRPRVCAAGPRARRARLALAPCRGPRNCAAILCVPGGRRADSASTGLGMAGRVWRAARGRPPSLAGPTRRAGGLTHPNSGTQ